MKNAITREYSFVIAFVIAYVGGISSYEHDITSDPDEFIEDVMRCYGDPTLKMSMLGRKHFCYFSNMVVEWPS